MENLRNIYESEGKKAVAKKILDQLEISRKLKREVSKIKAHIMISSVLYEYIKITAKSERRLGERLNEIILSDVMKVAEEEPGIF